MKVKTMKVSKIRNAVKNLFCAQLHCRRRSRNLKRTRNAWEPSLPPISIRSARDGPLACAERKTFARCKQSQSCPLILSATPISHF